MFSLKHFAIAGLIALFVLYVPQAIAMDPPSSLTADAGPVNYHIETAQACNTSLGLDCNKLKEKESKYWCNTFNDRWSNNEMCSNEVGNSGDRSDDYHIGYAYNSGNVAVISVFYSHLLIASPNITGHELIGFDELAGSRCGYNATINKTYNSINPVSTDTIQYPSVLPSGKINNIDEKGGDADV